MEIDVDPTVTIFTHSGQKKGCLFNPGALPELREVFK